MEPKANGFYGGVFLPYCPDFNKHHNQYRSPRICINQKNNDRCRWVRAHFQPRTQENLCSEFMHARTHTRTQSQSHLAHITKRADNRSWAQCGRVECVVRPSTQMSMFHFGEWRERSAWRRGRGEEFGRLRKSRRECCWSVSGREKVRLEMTEGKKERQAACVFMLCRD